MLALYRETTGRVGDPYHTHHTLLVLINRLPNRYTTALHFERCVCGNFLGSFLIDFPSVRLEYHPALPL